MYKLALGPGEPKRLEVRPPRLGRRTWDVWLDGRELGRIETHDEAVAGRSFPLGDGTTITVRLEPTQQVFRTAYRLRVERDGALLPDSPGHPMQIVRQGAIALYAVGILSMLAGVVLTALSGRTPTIDVFSSVGMALQGAFYVGLGYAAGRGKRWALITGLVLYVLDTLASLLTAGAGGWIVRVVVLSALVRAIQAHRQLDHVDASSVAAVFR